MSAIVLNTEGLTVSTYAGPDLGPDKARKRWQLRVTGGIQDAGNPPGTDAIITLSRPQWAALGEYFGWDCSCECEGPHLDCELFCNHEGKERA
jgi:hypothetical protein